MNTSDTQSRNHELRRMMDFQKGDVLCIPEGDMQIMGISHEGKFTTLVYLFHGSQKKLIDLCTREYTARTRA